MYRHIQATALALAATASGCDEAMTEDWGDVAIEDGAVRPRALHDNGVELNGTRINGTRFNGTRFNGTWFNGARLVWGRQTIGVKTRQLSGWSLVPGSSELQATASDGAVYSGEQLVGAELRLQVDADVHGVLDVTLKIAGVTVSAELPDVYFTDLHFRVGDGDWQSLCTDGAGEPTETIVVPGSFDPVTADWLAPQQGELAFACRGTAAGKCVEWGYRMWAEQGDVPLGDHYRACTRMVRADYCGNDVPHTENGTPIDISDGLAPPILVPETDWAVEAKWGPEGALCLNQPRRPAYTREAVIAECQSAGRGTLPSCDDDDPGEHGGLLMSQSSSG